MCQDSPSTSDSTITAVMNKLYHLGFRVDVEMGDSYPQFQLSDFKAAQNPDAALAQLGPALKQKGFDFKVTGKLITIFDASLIKLGDRYPLNKQIDLNVKDEPIKACLNKIEKASGIKLILISFGGDKAKTITINSKLSFREILDQISSQTGCAGWTTTWEPSSAQSPDIVISL